MVQSLGHRGPDSQGSLIHEVGDWVVGLGHTRLAILDLTTAGHQPMPGARPGNWLIYKGEVYNFQELAAGLEARGCRFRSHSDTEVIVQGCESEGPAFVERLRGMFAFAHLDENNRNLLLARDPLGIKPLYYHHRDGLFVFASEVRALLATGWVSRRASQQGLQSYLEFGALQAPLTILEDVRSLLPGELFHVPFGADRLALRGGRIEAKLFASESRTVRRADAAAELRATLEESVRLHLISDVPLGVFLSGGIDSSAIVALASRHASSRVKTFAVVFDEKEFSESSHARRIADLYGTEHHEIALSEQALLGMMPQALAAMDQPTADGVNTYVISKAVRSAGVTVALSGLGGDELFAGYPSFQRALQVKRLRPVPRAIRKAGAAAGSAMFNGSVAASKFWSLLSSDASSLAACRSLRQMFSAVEIAALTGRTHTPTSAQEAAASSGDPINQVSQYEVEGYMANTLLRDSDCMSMAHALEIRVPFVDSAVVRMASGFPGSMKLDAGRPKCLLLDAMGDLLPVEIWRRPKMGFTLPFRQWMLASLRGEIDQSLSDSGPLPRLGIRADLARKVWMEFQQSQQKERWPRSWTLYVLGKWCEQNRVSL